MGPAGAGPPGIPPGRFSGRGRQAAQLCPRDLGRVAVVLVGVHEDRPQFAVFGERDPDPFQRDADPFPFAVDSHYRVAAGAAGGAVDRLQVLGVQVDAGVHLTDDRERLALTV